MVILKVNLAVPSRLDRYLKQLYPSLTQGMLERALRLKQIMVNSHKVATSLRVIGGDEIFIEDRLKLQQATISLQIFCTSVIKLADKVIKDYLIYEDEQFIAINKPAGLATQGGSKVSLSINDVLCYLNQQGADLKLVHRLDKHTSGILLIAKNYLSSVKLTGAFQKNIIQKTYLAITLGRPVQDEGKVSGFIGKKRSGAYEIVQDDPENGKLAITYYKLLKILNDNLSLLELTPRTGRMHQLRFHTKLLNCPIIGDTKYGTTASMVRSKQMLLHAKSIVLPIIIFGKEIVINAKLPDYFTKYLPMTTRDTQ